MLRIKNLANTIFRKNRSNNKTPGRNRSFAPPLLIAVIAISSAVALSVSVESRSWLWSKAGSSTVKDNNAKVATTANGHTKSLNSTNSRGPSVMTPFAPTVTASKTDSLSTDVDNDTKADPGDTLQYTVQIHSSGEDATGVNFSDTVDPNTDFVAGTLMTTPLARADSYSAAGNIRISVAAPGVLANDSDPDGVGPAISVTAGTFLSANGGNVTLSSDGSFTFNPAPGFEGTDTFTYTLNDGEGPSDTGTVSISVSGMIWFINNNAVCPCDGRLTNPFNTLSAFNAVNDAVGNHPAANDNIFVYESATDYVGPVTLLNGQKFIGQDATASLSSISGVTPPAGSDPLPSTNPAAPIVNITSASAGITVAQNNILRGFAGGNAAPDISGSGFGTLNVSDVTLNGNGGALTLSTGTLNGTFGSISSTNSGTTGISLTSVGGSLTTGSTTITNATNSGISVNTSSLTLSFANTSVTGSGGTGVSLTTNTGTITFGDLDISPDAGQKGLLATDNTNTITVASGTVSATVAAAVEITRASSTTPLVMVFDSISANGGNNGVILSRTSGSFTVNGSGTTDGSGGTIQNIANRGASFSNSTNVTLKNMNFTNANTSDAGGAGTCDDTTTSGCNAALYLNTASSIVLDNLNLTGTIAEQGINGVSVNDLSLTNSTISNAGLDNGGADLRSEEGAIKMRELTGTAVLDNDILSFSGGPTVEIKNTTGNLLLNTNSTQYRDTQASTVSGQGGLQVIATGTTSVHPSVIVNVNSCTFLRLRSHGVNVQALGTTDSGSASADVDVTTSTFDPDTGTMIGLDLDADDASTLAFNIVSNTKIYSKNGPAINVFGDVAANINGRINNNTDVKVLNNAGGSNVGSGIRANINKDAVAKIEVKNNVVNVASSDAGIDLSGIGKTAINAVNTLDGTVTGNNVTIGPVSTYGIVILAATNAGDTNAVCTNVASNAITRNPASIASFRARVPSANGAFRMQGFVTNAEATWNANGNTPTSSGGSEVSFGGSGAFASCTAALPNNGSLTPSSLTSMFALSSQDSTQESSALPGSAKKNQNILWANNVEKPFDSFGQKASPSDLSYMVQAALERWRESGAISLDELALLQSVRFEIGDLPDGQLAALNSNVVTIDEDAAGFGWFVDASPMEDSEFDVPVPDRERQAFELSLAFRRVDLMTVIMRQLGLGLNQKTLRQSNLQSTLMRNTLSTGTRRAPTLKSTSKVSTTTSPVIAKLVRSKNDSEKSYRQVAANTANQRVLRNHAMRAPMSFSDINLNIGTLPAGKTITITFKATVKDPFPGPGASVCNQGTVSGSNFSSVLTDDPDVGGSLDPTCTTIDLQADLEVTKSDSPDPVVAGTNLTYTINLTNHGPSASGATVTDATPAGTTFVSASVTTGTGWGVTSPSVGGTGNVVFSKPSTANGETAVFQIVVKVASSVASGSTINNSATAATTGATDPVPGNNTGSASTSVIAQADLSITKTDGATTEIPGTSVTYTIVVSNSGPSDANGVSMADTFPSDLTGVTFTSVAAGGATGNTAAGAGNISDTLNMPTGSSVTYTVNSTIKSSATGSLSNTATVTAPGGVTDPTPANNSATDTDTLTPQADLSITKTDGSTTEVPGTPVTYTVVVTNNGPSDAPGSTATDTFPVTLTGVTFTSVAAGGATGNTAAGSGNISDTLNLPSGSSVTYTINATIDDAATGTLSNTATVAAGSGVTDPNGANNSATDTDTLTPQADLAITKTDGSSTEVPGTPVTYTITVTNNGPSEANGASVVDTFPGTLSGVTFTSVAAGGATGNTAAGSGNINDTVNLPSGSSITYTATANIASSATGGLSNTATVTAPGTVTDPTPNNNSATDTDTLVPSADVSVTKTDSPDPVVVGNNITYTITVTNNGPSDAQSLSLSDAVPTNTTLVSVTTPSGWTRTDVVPAGGTGTLTFTRASLTASGSSVFTLVVNVNLATPNGTTITNTANVSSTTTDATPGNNSATATTLVQSNADLAVSKTRSPNTSSIDAGSNVTYTIQVVNNGPAAATNVTLTDAVPAGTSLVSQSNPGGWSCNTIPAGGNGSITCTKASMANGETATLTVVVTVNCDVAHGSSIGNTATIGAVSPTDNDSSNNTSNTSFTVNNPAVTVAASVTLSQLPQNSHELLDVGLAALASGGTANCPPGPLSIQVFGDEDDETPTASNEVFSPDAKDIAVGTLRLRAERVSSGNGRVYLIVVRSGSAFATVTVVVPKSSSQASINAVIAEAAAAKAYADTNGGAAPAGYYVIGDGPIIGNKQ